MSPSIVVRGLALVWIIVSAYLGSVSAFVGLIGIAADHVEDRRTTPLQHLRTALLFYVSAVVVWTWTFDSSGHIIRNVGQTLLTFVLTGVTLALSWAFVQVLNRMVPIEAWWPWVRIPARAFLSAMMLEAALIIPNRNVRIACTGAALLQLLMMAWEFWLRRHYRER